MFIYVFIRNAAEFLGALTLRASHVSRHTSFPSSMPALCAKQRPHKSSYSQSKLERKTGAKVPLLNTWNTVTVVARIRIWTD